MSRSTTTSSAGVSGAILGLAALVLPLVPTVTLSQTDSAPRDALGNTGNVGSGAVFWPQTPQSIARGGGTLQVEGIEIAGAQILAVFDALGNTGNVGSGAVFRPQTPTMIEAGGGTLAEYAD